MPAIYNLAGAGLLDNDFSIIVVDWADISADQLRQGFHDSLENFVTSRGTEAVTLHGDVWEHLASRIDYVRGSFEDGATYDTLAKKTANRNCIFYLAVAARFFGTIVDHLGSRDWRAKPAASSVVSSLKSLSAATLLPPWR